jgi:hypothetical protein
MEVSAGSRSNNPTSAAPLGAGTTSTRLSTQKACSTPGAPEKRNFAVASRWASATR